MGAVCVQLIIVHSRLSQARTITVQARHVAIGVVSLLGLVLAAAMLIHYLTLGQLLQLPWAQRLVHTTIPADSLEDAYARENLNLMARRVGEMQAKIMQIDALGERISGMAGVEPSYLQNESGKAPGRGGLLISPQDMSLQALTEELDRLERQLAERADYLSIVDARLTQAQAQQALLPSVAPISEGFKGSPFGWRIDPFTGRRAMHEGVDFNAPLGTPILAAAGGVVVVAEYHPAYGYMVDIDHGNNLLTRYAHASRLRVKQGDLVRRGQHIADLGSTGRSTGPHLHFEVRVGGVAVDPMRFLAQAPSGGVAGLKAPQGAGLSMPTRPGLSLEELRRNADPAPR
jgi:murein DD-endopeptidase MepM/ murein hydrolase activator NlpD